MPSTATAQRAAPDDLLVRVMDAYGADSAEALLTSIPRAYHLPGMPASVSDGSPVTFIGTIKGEYRTRKGKRLGNVRTSLSVPGFRTLPLSWVSHPSKLKAMAVALGHQYPPGSTVMVSGKVSLFGDPAAPGISIDNPDMDRPDPALIRAHNAGQAVAVPVYRLTGKLRQDEVRRAMREAFAEARFTSHLPAALQTQLNLMPLQAAYAALHGLSPISPEEVEAFRLGSSRYHQRVQIERLWDVMQGMHTEASGRRDPIPLETEDLTSDLAFELTGGQRDAIRDVADDLRRGGTPARRLIQGDVGSGKSVVAYTAAVAAARAGEPVVLMAPTDILAEQLQAGVAEMAANAGVKVLYLSGKSRAAERRKAEKAAADGKPAIFVGTHAVSGLPLQRLGLLVIDEEQRFGVEIKDKLRALGPHEIVMSATPIPRSLATVVYAGQSISVIREKPKDREPVRTRLLHEDQGLDRLHAHMDEIFAAGRQAFVVCPSIDSEEMANVTDTAKKLTERFGEKRVGAIHGAMADKEIDKTLEDFRNGEFACLVATSIVEVGINVPNATLMVVMDPHRLGLAQLHQIRGRVGRGQHRGYCALVASTGSMLSEKARERLQFFSQCYDGFELAEKDMKLRGTGDLAGTAQSGFLDLDIMQLSEEAKVIHDYLCEQKTQMQTLLDESEATLDQFAPTF